MKLVTYRNGAGAPRLGIQLDRGVVDVAATGRAQGAEVPATMLELVAGHETMLAALRGLLEGELVIAEADGLQVLAPLRPGKLIGVGLNYSEHVDESARTLNTDKDLPTRPVLFDKPATAVVGPGEPIQHDRTLTEQLDWECELAVVIGKRARRVSAADALDHVFGYSIVNDISARDQRRGGQWFFSKGQDSYAPFGPAIVTADEIPDPQDVDLSLRVNGVVKQDSNTRYMLFDVRQLIVDITSGMTLEPGDVIATGSPSGVGAGMDPPEFLQPGDEVECTIDGIGVLGNPVIDASAGA